MIKKPFFGILLVVIFVFLMAGGFFLYPKNKGKLEEETLGETVEQVREPAVAGAFYPGDKDALEEQIDGFLANVSKQEVEKPAPSSTPRDEPSALGLEESEAEGNLRILIVPHAGYSYSGPVAAHAFKQLEDKNYSRVILIGGSHQARFSEAAVDENNYWETPLGKVAIDSEFVQKLINAGAKIIKNSEVHAAEHSLEVELPFLQTVLNQFKIVPILLGDDSNELTRDVTDALSKIVDDTTLIVVSTDLSHYPSCEDANSVDKKTIATILGGDVTELERIITEQMAQGVPNLATCVCGEGAVKVGMYLAKSLGEGEWRLLKYANSGDTGVDRTRVVGYAAIGFFATAGAVKPMGGGITESTEETEGTEELNYGQQAKLLEIARETLETYLTEGKMPEFEIDDQQLNQHLGAFVTLRKNGQLRGCIGEFEPNKPLWQVIREKAIDAATHDPRFLPVTADELDGIKIEISVLSSKEKITDPNQIKLGKHGVVIQKGSHSGVFLPQVAAETGWGFEEFMGQLCSQKASLPWDCWKDPSISLYTFTAQVFTEE